MTAAGFNGLPKVARKMLGPDQIDDLGEALLALTREVWVLTDRLAILEAVLQEEGVDIARVDLYEPGPALMATLEVRRQKLVDQILSALKAGPDRA